MIGSRIEEIYPLLDEFTASLRRDDILQVLRTTDLGAVNESLRDDGIGLVRASPTGYEFVTDGGPLAHSYRRDPHPLVFRAGAHGRIPGAALCRTAVRRLRRGRAGVVCSWPSRRADRGDPPRPTYS